MLMVLGRGLSDGFVSKIIDSEPYLFISLFEGEHISCGILRC